MENKKKKKPVWKIVLIVLIGLIVISAMFDGTDTSLENNNNNSNTNNSSKKEETNKEKVLYNDENLVIKVVDYDPGISTDTINVTLYMENKTKENLVFNLETPVIIDGYSIDNGFLYEEVAGGTKTNKEFTIYGLSDNKLKSNSIKNMKFSLSVYKSENYIKTKYYLNKKQFEYNF